MMSVFGLPLDICYGDTSEVLPKWEDLPKIDPFDGEDDDDSPPPGIEIHLGFSPSELRRTDEEDLDEEVPKPRETMKMSEKYPTISLRFPDGAEAAYRAAAIASGFIMANGRTANLSAWIRHVMQREAVVILGEKGYAKAVKAGLKASQSSVERSPTGDSERSKNTESKAPVKAKAATKKAQADPLVQRPGESRSKWFARLHEMGRTDKPSK